MVLVPRLKSFWVPSSLPASGISSTRTALSGNNAKLKCLRPSG